jgi:hypothetical protein
MVGLSKLVRREARNHLKSAGCIEVKPDVWTKEQI